MDQQITNYVCDCLCTFSFLDDLIPTHFTENTNLKLSSSSENTTQLRFRENNETMTSRLPDLHAAFPSEKPEEIVLAGHSNC